MSELAGSLPIREDPDAVRRIYEKYIKRPEAETDQAPAALPAVPLNMSDNELLDMILNSRQGTKFSRLFYRGDISGHGNDSSAADMALMVMLAFWTQKDAARMERLFSSSALGQREKWRTRPDYRQRTVSEACKWQKDVYSPGGTNSPFFDFAGSDTDLNTGEYILSNGIFKKVFDKKGNELTVKVFPAVVYPVGILENIVSKTAKTELKWILPGEERIIPVSNDVISDKAKIIRLANYRLPVTSSNARGLVDYLADIMELNADKIPVKRSVSSLGWQNEKCFVPYDGDLTVDNFSAFSNIYEAIGCKGTLQEWTDYIKNLLPDVRIRLMLAASFGSVILTPVMALPFIVHLRAESGSGKTVALAVAASIWGNPRLGSYLQNIDSTVNYTMATLSFLKNLPLCADELQSIKTNNIWGNYDRFIMKVCEGADRGRMRKDLSLTNVASWKCIILTSGEEPLTNENSGGGAHNRVLEIDTEEGCKLFPGTSGNEAMSFLSNHYGKAGQAFVQVVENAGFAAVKNLYDCYFADILAADVTTEKQALSAAVLMTADTIASQQIYHVEPMALKDIFPFLKDKGHVDQAERSYHMVIETLEANLNRFKIYGEDSNVIMGEIWGTYYPPESAKTGYEKAGTFFVNLTILSREMRKMGFVFDAVKKSWASRGFLIRDSKGGYYHQRNVMEDGKRSASKYVKLLSLIDEKT